MLNRLNAIPDGLLTCSAEQLFSIIPDNTLIELQGKNKEPLFLSILLHGNETTGLSVAQNILNKYINDELPRSLLLFIGNVSAARQKKRRLENQPDFNRIWLEAELKNESEEHHVIAELLHDIARRPLFASIDIHNNTGLNPHYACINRLDYRFINFARKFSRTIIYFISPGGVQSKAFANLCPSVTLECGQPGDEYGIQRTTTFVDDILNSDSHSAEQVNEHEIDLLHTTAIIKIPDNISINFGEGDADLNFIKGIETLNFEEIPKQTKLATCKHGLEQSILVLSEEGENITGDLFQVNDGQLINTRPLMLSMLTMEESIIRQDCLCYVMERYEIAMGEKISDEAKPVWI